MFNVQIKIWIIVSALFLLPNTASAQSCLDTFDPDSTSLSDTLKCLKAERNLLLTPAVPIGTIIAWYSPNKPIPFGWSVCDGTNGTPDLRMKFLRGVGTMADTGFDTKASDNHVHTGRALSNDEGHPKGYTAGTSLGNDDSTWSTYKHTHPLSQNSASHIPPNFKVVYLMRVK